LTPTALWHANREQHHAHLQIQSGETGKTQQQPDDVTTLLRAYGADVEHVDHMAALAARADQGTWWAPFGDVLPNSFKTLVGLEGLAACSPTSRYCCRANCKSRITPPRCS
jgi:hypothetical protein